MSADQFVIVLTEMIKGSKGNLLRKQADLKMLHAFSGFWVVQPLLQLNYHRDLKDYAHCAKCYFQCCLPNSHQRWWHLCTNNYSSSFGSEWMKFFPEKPFSFFQLCFTELPRRICQNEIPAQMWLLKKGCVGVHVYVCISLCVYKVRSWSKNWFKARTQACMHSMGTCTSFWHQKDWLMGIFERRESSSVWHLVKCPLASSSVFLAQLCDKGLQYLTGLQGDLLHRVLAGRLPQDRRVAISNFSPFIHCSSWRTRPWFYLECFYTSQA